MDLVLKNCRLIDEVNPCFIGIEDGKIKTISKSPIVGERIIDIKYNILSSGFIDPHVHFRDPGFPEKETFKTGSMAAANGGFTMVFDMPNTDPKTDTYKSFKDKIKIGENKSLVDFGLHSGINGLDEIRKIVEFKPISFKMFMDLGLDHEIEENFKNLSILNKEMNDDYRLSLHCENKEIIEKNSALFRQKEVSAIDYSHIRDTSSELSSINQGLRLSEKYGVPIHICHLSTKAGLRSVMDFKKKKNIVFQTSKNKKSFKRKDLVSTEVTPHHLLLTNESFNIYGTVTKTNPPLRPLDENLIVDRLKDIDVVGTDHAPHTLDDKNKGVWDSLSGIPGLETVVPLLITQVNKGNLNLKTVLERLSSNPARVFNLKTKGKMAIGYDADFTVLDIKKEGKLNIDKFYTKAEYSPFEGVEYKGTAVMTILRGEVIMDDGEVYNTQGRYINS
ncbi:MAG: dihydroorotase family protein [Methanobrevibacter sp.]|jgi:dihydroorotase|nr:dihydroorotase family protein [Candidatus Methanovirga aequatorialis]